MENKKVLTPKKEENKVSFQKTEQENKMSS